jgi:hypothetical protein
MTKKVTLILSALILTQTIMAVNATESREQAVRQRCTEESLNNDQALGRVQWGLRCKLIPRAYYEHAINSRYYPRIWYPVGTRKNPTTLLNEYKDMPTTKYASCDKIENYQLSGQCLSSCYTPDQELLFAEGEMTIYDAFTNRVQKIVTLSDDATFEQLDKTERDIFTWVVSIKDIEHDILVVNTENGQLKVTPNHPLVLSDGKMVTAGALQVGQSLIREDGDFAKITSINQIKYYGKVYNVEPDATDENGQQIMNGHVLIAQGFLSGSNFYQNSDEAKYMNQYLLRHQIPGDLLN